MLLGGGVFFFFFSGMMMEGIPCAWRTEDLLLLACAAADWSVTEPCARGAGTRRAEDGAGKGEP